jgi:hypothetical protein
MIGSTILAVAFLITRKYQKRKQCQFLEGVKYAEDELRGSGGSTPCDLLSRVDEARAMGYHNDFDKGITGYVNFHIANTNKRSMKNVEVGHPES